MRKLFSILLQVTAVVFVALLVRLQQGASMFDPFFFIPFACLSAILAGPILIGLHRESRDSMPILVRRAVIRACSWMLAILAASVLAFNLLPWTGAWLFPEWTTALYAALMSVTTTAAMAMVMALFLLRLPAGAAKWLFRGIMLALLLLYRAVPAEWSGHTIEAVLERGLSTVVLTAAAALTLLDVGLLRWLAGPAVRNKPRPVADL